MELKALRPSPSGLHFQGSPHNFSRFRIWLCFFTEFLDRMQSRASLLALATLLVVVVALPLNAEDDEDDENQLGQTEEEKQAELNAHVRNIIKHFKQDDPLGLPQGLDHHVPDPMPVPNLKKDFSGTAMTFEDLKVHGLSKFRLDHVRSDISALKVSVGVSIDQLTLLGKYSMSSWFMGRGSGDFSLIIYNITTEAEAGFDVSPEGFLKVEQVEMDLKFKDIKMNFENAGWIWRFIQGMVNSIGSFLFDSIKPMILEQIETDVRETLSRQARDAPLRFPNSLNPLDMALASARNEIKKRGLDPFALPNYQTASWAQTFDLTNGQLEGLSTIHRTGSIILGFEDNIIYVTVHLGAENLKGKYRWTVGMMNNWIRRKGDLEFNVEYVSVAIRVKQPANLDLLPEVEELDLDIGNIAVLSEGAGTLDYVAEALFNILPNIFRSQIIDAIEKPVCQAIEEELRKLKLEEMIEENLPRK